MRATAKQSSRKLTDDHLVFSRRFCRSCSCHHGCVMPPLPLSLPSSSLVHLSTGSLLLSFVSAFFSTCRRCGRLLQLWPGRLSCLVSCFGRSCSFSFHGHNRAAVAVVTVAVMRFSAVAVAVVSLDPFCVNAPSPLWLLPACCCRAPKGAVTKKLEELMEEPCDEVFPEYITVMVSNGKTIRCCAVLSERTDAFILFKPTFFFH